MAAASQETQRLKDSEQVLQKILKSQDVAAWYRMLSKNQVSAISKLTNALRDDGEQGSTYRVYTCLSTLGINPLIKRKYLKKLICMSRGSDLAFLYFLLEGFYRCKRAGYTYNEQVLMSSIMHLDLHMTLRELDLILPPGHLSAENQERLNKKNFLKAKALQSPPQAKVHRATKHKLPYFWRQPRPKQPAKFASKTSKQSDVVVHFPFWPVGKKPYYKVSKVNRWFATYQLNPVRYEIYRMVKGIIDDYWQRSSVGQPVRDQNPLCHVHREILKQEQLMKDELTLKAHNYLLKLIDVTARKNEQRKKRIIGQLNKDIEECAQRWKKLETRQYTDTMLLKDNNLCECARVMTTPQNSKLKCVIGMDDYNPIAHTKTMATSTVVDITDKDTVIRCKSGQVSEPEEQCTHITNTKDDVKPECTDQLKRPIKKNGKRRRSIAFSKIMETGGEVTKLALNSKYFRSPQLHQPYIFHYHHTFHQCCTPLEPIQVIHRQALGTLKNPPETTDLSTNETKHKACTCREPTECTKEKVIQAIVMCAEQMWQNSMKSFTKVCTIPPRKEAVCSTQDPCSSTAENDVNCKVLTYNRSYYDPNDSKLMETMLRDGMSILRKDPRFVFASFPDSHKTILMREWIKRRYGKTYTHTEIAGTMKNAGLAFRAVINLQSEPPSVDLSSYRNEKTNYINRGKMDKKARELTWSYNRALNEKLMQHTAFCWSFMGGQFWKSGYCTNNFFAYLPARNVDVLRIRPWSGSKRNMIDARRAKEDPS